MKKKLKACTGMKRILKVDINTDIDAFHVLKAKQNPLSID
jgi:hypothetical protein